MIQGKDPLTRRPWSKVLIQIFFCRCFLFSGKIRYFSKFHCEAKLSGIYFAEILATGCPDIYWSPSWKFRKTASEILDTWCLIASWKCIHRKKQHIFVNGKVSTPPQIGHKDPLKMTEKKHFFGQIKDYLDISLTWIYQTWSFEISL